MDTTPLQLCVERSTSIVIGGDDANSDYRYGLYRIGEGIVVSPSFYEICAGDCNYYCFRDDSGRIGMIDRNGNVVLSLAYTDENSTILYMSRSSHNVDIHIWEAQDTIQSNSKTAQKSLLS